MKKLIFEGTATAMVTPFNEKGIYIIVFSSECTDYNLYQYYITIPEKINMYFPAFFIITNTFGFKFNQEIL